MCFAKVSQMGCSGSLVRFVKPYFYITDELGRNYPNDEAIQQLARLTDRYLPRSPVEAVTQFQDDREFLLDAVDFALGQQSPNSDSYRTKAIVDKLNAYLAEARSTYVVGVDGDGQCELQNRQPEELTSLIAAAFAVRDRAGEHLHRAWSKAFARRRDPTGACLEAVAAIEVAAKPVVSPRNSKATLGTLIRDMRLKPSKWITDSDADDDVITVVTMMEMVWTGHFRHGDETKPIDISDEGAVMIVQLAALLVHWFQSTRIRIR